MTSRPNAGIYGNPKVGVSDAVGNAQKDGHSARNALMIEGLKESMPKLPQRDGRRKRLKGGASDVG
jgi:hypothetical protein